MAWLSGPGLDFGLACKLKKIFMILWISFFMITLYYSIRNSQEMQYFHGVNFNPPQVSFGTNSMEVEGLTYTG